MDFTTLEAFLTLAETLNYTRASEQLYISQSALSRQISRLEAAVGYPLFARNRREVELTAEGHVFLDDCRDLVRRWRESLEHVAEAAQGVRGRVVLGILQDAPSQRLACILKDFRTAFPDIRMEFREYGQSGVIQALLTREIDVAFTLQEPEEEFPGVTFLQVEAHPLCAVVRRDDPLAAQARVSLREMAGRDLVLISPSCSEIGVQSVIRQFREKGLAPRVAAYAEIVPSLIMLVESGVGVGTLPKSAQRMVPDTIAFVPMEYDRGAMYTVLAKRNDNPNPAAGSFLTFAGKCLADMAQ